MRLFAQLEKQELENALSLSEDALTKAAERPAGNLREKLLAALQGKAREKRLAITVQRRRALDIGRRLMNELVRARAEEWGQEVQDALAQELPGSRVDLEWSVEENRHWFKYQIVQIAESNGYYCDIETFHEWLRLRVRRPDESEMRFSELVISMHSLGRLFTGVLAVNAYLARRVLDDEGRSQTLEPKGLSERPLTFSSHESEENVGERLEGWISMVLDNGLAELARSL